MRVLDEKEELFCRFVSDDVEPVQAYIQAGFKGPCGQAAVIAAENMMKDSAISERIMQLAVKKTNSAQEAEDEDNLEADDITKNVLIAELWKVYRKATAAGNHTAANRSLELIGKEKGMFADTKKVKFNKPIKDMNRDELEALVRENEAGGDDIITRMPRRRVQ